MRTGGRWSHSRKIDLQPARLRLSYYAITIFLLMPIDRLKNRRDFLPGTKQRSAEKIELVAARNFLGRCHTVEFFVDSPIYTRHTVEFFVDSPSIYTRHTGKFFDRSHWRINIGSRHSGEKKDRQGRGGEE